MKATAIAHSNIALVKYWGKRDKRLNLPAVGSISLTLRELHTRTTIELSPQLDRDMLLLNSQRAAPKAEQRVSRFLDIFREITGAVQYAKVESENNFPTGAGLASSASGFAALAVAANRAFNSNLSPARLSEIARRGSGSAARSIFGGFVEMSPGSKPDGSDAVARPLHDENFWPLNMLILITSEVEKETGSSQGMTRTADTSPFYRAWAESSPGDMEAMRSAIAAKDLQQVGEIAEFSCLKMHGLALSARPGLLYWNSSTVALIHEVRRLRQRGIPAYFTIDAGPQVKVLCLPEDTSQIQQELAEIEGIKKIFITSAGPGAKIVNGG